MKNFRQLALVAFLVLFFVTVSAERACNACGPECSGACGTAMFRACCFNYNRKRSLHALQMPTQLDATPGSGFDSGASSPVTPAAATSGQRQPALVLFRPRNSNIGDNGGGCAIDY